MFCTHCGAKLRDGSKFCTFCGTAVENTDNTGAADRVQNTSYQDPATHNVPNDAAPENFSEPISSAAPVTSSSQDDMPINSPEETKKTIQQSLQDSISECNPDQIQKLPESETLSQALNTQAEKTSQVNESQFEKKPQGDLSPSEHHSPSDTGFRSTNIEAPIKNDEKISLNNENSNCTEKNEQLSPAHEKYEPKHTYDYKQENKEEINGKKIKTQKTSPGVVLLSLFLSILFLLFATGASIVGIARNVLEKNSVSKIVDGLCDNSDELSKAIYSICTDILGRNIANHPELTEESIKAAVETVKKDKALNRDINRYLTAYTDYVLNGGKLEGITGDNIVSIIKRINDKSHVYDLSKKDINEIKELDLSSVSKIDKTFDFDLSIIRYPVSVPVYVILIILAAGMAVLILCAGSWKPRAVFTYVSVAMIIIGILFLLASGAFLVLSFAGDAAWILGAARYSIAFVAVRGGAYFIVGLTSVLTAKAVRKKKHS